MAIGPAGRSDAIEMQVLQQVASAVAASNLARAYEVANWALGQGLRHPSFFNARALWFQQQGRYQDALKDFEQALQFMPREVTLLNALGLCLTRLNRADEAIAFFDQALDIKPGSAITHYRKGWALGMTGDWQGAQASYRRAVELDPKLAEPLAGLASIAARNGDIAGARDYAARALNIDPNEPTAIIALAMADNAEQKYIAAEQRLKSLLSDPRTLGHTRAVALGFLGDALDGQDRAAEAFSAYSSENEELYRLSAPRFAGMPRATATLESLRKAFETIGKGRWAPSQSDDGSPNPARQHVFLLGFLRSGTTLLEKVLAAHPDVTSLEERESFSGLTPEYLNGEEALSRLADLSGKGLEAARENYWRKVAEFGGTPQGKIFIDKQPLNTFNLPLIAKLFPKAKILFAIRDPRDVVFSCFRRHFEVNAVMFELLRLEDAAKFYATVMQLAESFRGGLPLNIHEHRYEAMVEDFDASVQSACNFIGIGWTDAMRDFSAKTRQETVRSPSAAQVRRPLYQEGVGQWRRYEREMAPAMPALIPWIRRFGYS